MERGISELHELEDEQSNREHMPTLITVNPDFVVNKTSELLEGSSDAVEPNNEAACDVTVVVEQSTDSGSMYEEVKLDSCDVGFSIISEVNTQDAAIQTVITGEEIQTKTVPRNSTSAEVCPTSTATLSSDVVAQTGDHTKLPSYVQNLSDVVCSKKSAKDKRRRRRKRSPDAGHLVKNNLKLKSTHFDLLSNESGSSGDLPDEPLFDLELSSDEIDGTPVLTSVGRTVSMPLIDHKQVRTDEWANSQYAAAIHPFSDGDLTPLLR